MLRPEDEGVGAFEQAEFLPGLGGGIGKMGAMGIAEMDEDTDLGADDAGEGRHFSRMGNPGLHEMEVGLVVEGPQGKGNPDLAVPASRAAGDPLVLTGQCVGPFLDGGLAVGSGDADDLARPGKAGEGAELLQGEQGVGNAEHDGTGEGPGPIASYHEGLDPFRADGGEMVVAIMARALKSDEHGAVNPATRCAQFSRVGGEVAEPDVGVSAVRPMQGAAELVGQGVEGETVDRHASSRWCSRTTTSL